MNVSVIGLGRLGLPFAFFLASYNHKVFGLDTNIKVKEIIDNIISWKESSVEL